MKKAVAAFLLLSMLAVTAMAQSGTLKFNKDGKFKIVQFTDLHLKYKDVRSDVAWENMTNVIKSERPDLIMITGDMVYTSPSIELMHQLMQFLDKTGIPFAFTFGNHDREQGSTNEELLAIGQKYKGCIAYDTPGLYGCGNYDLTVKSHDGKRDAAILYCIDSGEISPLESHGIKGYDYIHFDQIDWYMNRSKAHSLANASKPLPSLAFFHIPLQEYNTAVVSQDCTMYGIRREKPCSPLINSGMFAAIKEMGDVMGIFCGHDHDNDFAVAYYGVLLAYGRFSGGNTEYNNIHPNGARVITLNEDSFSFDTWIRLRTGEMEQFSSFPYDYTKHYK